MGTGGTWGALAVTLLAVVLGAGACAGADTGAGGAASSAGPSVGGIPVASTRASAAAAGSSAAAAAWSAVDDFVYQLQNVDLKAMGKTRFDVCIIDYSADGHDATRYTRAQIRALQHSPGGPKRVLAYMSIGEAETYRWYWRPSWDANKDGRPDPGAPAWLGPSNPDWPDNYKVRYWYPAWQRLIFGTPQSYVDKVMAAGFDGVYLDIIDAYEYWGPGGESGLDRRAAAQEMVDFVRAIAHYARVTKHDPSFAVFPQNGADLGAHPEYMSVVTGIGQEDTWYNDNAKQPAADTAYTVAGLVRFRRAGKLVLCTDYCRRPPLIDTFYRKAQALGFVPYAAVRDLDRLVVNRGHAPR